MSASPESSGPQPAPASDTSSIPPSSPPSEASTPASTITPPTPISQAASASPASTNKAMSAALPSTPATSASNASPTNAPSGPSGALPMRKRTLADYRLGRTLGEGSYSTVVAAVEIATKRDYAIKILDKRHIIRENKVKYVNIEKNTLYKLDHPGVVKLYSTFQDMSSLYYVLELCQNGELLTFIKRLGSFDETCTRFYAAQILTAVEYVHSQGVIHRDLKPENILLDDRMYVKLTDFGTAKMLEPSEDGTESDRANSFVGTAEYVSPELLTEKAACKSSDLWALGCIIYQLLAGRPPFKGLNEYQTFQKIVKLEYTFPAGFPKDAMDLVSRLLVHDPNERLGANNRIDQLKEHPFFAGIEWSTLWEQPAPRLMPYLPPTPTHNTEALRSDHDTCLYNMNRAGEGLMVVDPFRELGNNSATSNSSVGDSGSNSISAAEGSESGEGDLAHHHRNSGALEAATSISSPLASGSVVAGISGPTQAKSELGIGSDESKDTNGKFPHALPPLLPVPSKPSSKPSSSTAASPANGHSKTKSNSSRNAFVALLSSINKSSHSSSKKHSSKKTKETQQPQRQGQAQIENLNGDVGRRGMGGAAATSIVRENSSVSLAVTANEISAYSRKSQLDLQHEHSPWQIFLLPTELIIHQTPVLKRKGLFSRACILVLTDSRRLLYFDDSNHYFSQLFNSNTNGAFSNWHQQQRIHQWEWALDGQSLGDRQVLQPPHRLYQQPSPSQDPQSRQQQQLNAALQPPQPLHPHPHNPQPRRNTGGLEGLKSGSGFLLFRNGSSKNRHQQNNSEHLSCPGQSVLPEEGHEDDGLHSPKATRSTRPSVDYTSAAGSHQHQHPHLHPHQQQTNGQNKVDVEKKRTSIASGSASASETLSSGPIVMVGAGPGSINGTTAASSTSSLGNSGTGSTSYGVPGHSGGHDSNGIKASPSPAPSSTTKAIKASKKSPKLLGEIVFTASAVAELKGKKCVFIHTTKKSYYFEESNQEGDAKLWVKVLERSMEEWFGEAGRNGHSSPQPVQ
ncbi:pkb-activating kinase-like protein [Mortierella antarctica]|nr:pkb-activating kinase-like protein [Mortierella antarctica]